MTSKLIQWMIVLAIALVLIIIGIKCYHKDNFYDFDSEGLHAKSNPYIKKYFKDIGADTENSLRDQRSLHMCELCRNLRETPNECGLCRSFIKGQQFAKIGVE